MKIDDGTKVLGSEKRGVDPAEEVLELTAEDARVAIQAAEKGARELRAKLEKHVLVVTALSLGLRLR